MERGSFSGQWPTSLDGRVLGGQSNISGLKRWSLKLSISTTEQPWHRALPHWSSGDLRPHTLQTSCSTQAAPSSGRCRAPGLLAALCAAMALAASWEVWVLPSSIEVGVKLCVSLWRYHWAKLPLLPMRLLEERSLERHLLGLLSCFPGQPPAPSESEGGGCDDDVVLETAGWAIPFFGRLRLAAVLTSGFRLGLKTVGESCRSAGRGAPAQRSSPRGRHPSTSISGPCVIAGSSPSRLLRPRCRCEAILPK
mmetsp:Transcript_4965/g.14503  ORF Transcript_4965/g.14503 Transcript_4965/m.14503 type:complete len:252 (+) Transcript_4965:114-869(+)